MTISLPTPKLPTLKFNRTAGIVVSALVLLGLVVLGAALYQRDVEAADRLAAVKAQNEAKQREATKNYIAQLETSQKAATATTDRVCQYVISLDNNKAITKSVAVPAECL